MRMRQAKAEKDQRTQDHRENSMSRERGDQSEIPIGFEGGEPPPEEEELLIIEEEDMPWDEDPDVQEIMGNERGTGQTYETLEAAEEGLSYTPPRDPPTVPSRDDPQGSEIAAGFAPSMEDSDPDREELPDRIDRSDLEIQEDVGLALRYNSETADLTEVSAFVNRGVVSLFGSVPSEDDIALVSDIVSDLEGVVDVISHLEVADW
jgi:hypothetical protein